MPAFFTEGPSAINSYTSTNASVSVICYTLVYKILLAFLYATYILFYFAISVYQKQLGDDTLLYKIVSNVYHPSSQTLQSKSISHYLQINDKRWNECHGFSAGTLVLRMTGEQFTYLLNAISNTDVMHLWILAQQSYSNCTRWNELNHSHITA